MKNYAEIMDKKFEELKTVGEVISIREMLEEKQRYTMDYVYDENGDIVLDENENRLRKIPEENSYGYREYMAYKTVLELVDNYLDKLLK